MEEETLGKRDEEGRPSDPSSAVPESAFELAYGQTDASEPSRPDCSSDL